MVVAVRSLRRDGSLRAARHWLQRCSQNLLVTGPNYCGKTIFAKQVCPLLLILIGNEEAITTSYAYWCSLWLTESSNPRICFGWPRALAVLEHRK